MPSEPETQRAILRGRHGDYAVLRELGRGGAGVTYRARRVSDGLPVVVKALRLDRLSDWNNFDLFERESAVLRSLAHPGIPAWLDHLAIGEPPKAFALVHTYIEGRALAEVMSTPGALAPEEMLAWFEDLLGVLEYLHGRAPPVIHRDVNPKNVILRAEGAVALVDFGSVQAAMQREGVLAAPAAGTFGYAAPEQLVDRATPASDLYGAAMTYLAVASGQQVSDMPADGIRVRVAEVLRADARLVRLLFAMTEPDPHARLADAATARQRVAQIRRSPDAGALAAPAFESTLQAHTGGSSAEIMGAIRARLEAQEFAIESGGEVASTALAFRASRAARLRPRAPALHLYVAPAESLEGYSGTGPVPAAPVALFAKAAGALPTEEGRIMEALWAPPATVVAVVVGNWDMAVHAAARVEAALQASGPPVVAAALVPVGQDRVVLMAPTAAWGGADEAVRDFLRSLLAGG